MKNDKMDKVVKRNRILLSISLVFLLPASVWGVTALEQAKRLQLVYTHLLDLRGNSAPVVLPGGSMEISGDLQPMPDVDTRIGAKTEPLDKLPASGRLRFRGFLLNGLMMGISGVPGLKVGNQKATSLQGEMGFRSDWGAIQSGLRFSLSSWEVEGPMTTSEYTDVLRLRQRNMDLVLGSRLGRWFPYAGMGKGIANSDLWIEESHITLSIQDHPYNYQFMGLGYFFENWSFNYEQHQTEDFLSHYQLSATRTF